MSSRAKQAASRANGALGGRPRKSGSAALQRIRRRARFLGESSVDLTVRFFIAVRDGLVKGATVADRMRAGENLLDRFGFPRMSQQEMVGDMPTKIIDMRGWDAPQQPDLKRPDAEPPPPQGTTTDGGSVH